MFGTKLSVTCTHSSPVNHWKQLGVEFYFGRHITVDREMAKTMSWERQRERERKEEEEKEEKDSLCVCERKGENISVSMWVWEREREREKETF